MTTLLALILAWTAAPQTTPLNALIDRVDRTFASMKDFSADFEQFSTNPVNQKQRDGGHLYLTKDKKMRWEYEGPEKQLFVSNGKTLYSYSPLKREATKEQVKDSTADQIPLMYLVGQSGLKNKFEASDLKTKPLFEGDAVIRLVPKRKNTGVQSIDIEVNPGTNLIDRMVILAMDKSRNELIFGNIVINSNIAASMFEFKPPPGTRVVQEN